MPSSQPSLRVRFEARFLRAMLGLPPGVIRRLAGAPVVVAGETLDPETHLMLRLDRLMGTPDTASVPIPEGRRMLARSAYVVKGDPPIGAVVDLKVAGAQGELPARLYRPTSLAEGETGPLLVFFHGGGWIFGDIETHDGLCRVLAEVGNVRVISVEYRLAPEARFPAAADDCVAAFGDIVARLDELHADPRRLAVGGDSAGGNLAAVVALEAARTNAPLALQFLIYPGVDFTRSMPSHRTYGEGLFLTEAFVDLAAATYLDGADEKDPRASVLFADVPDGVAPAYVATAGFDVLRDEGEAYAARLREAGVPVHHEHFPGLIHGFANAVGVGRSQPAAVERMARYLRSNLAHG